MAKKFRRALEVEALAEELIPTQHPHLMELRIEYVFGEEAPMKNDKATFGEAKRISGLNAQLANFDSEEDAKDFFAIVIYEDVWIHLSECQRLALVDHELEHCKTKEDKDGNTVLYLREHDLAEFSCIVERHGLWMDDVKQMALAFKKAQTTFPFQFGGSKDV